MDQNEHALYIDLALPLIDGKPFAGFVAGEFSDMYGREIVVTEEDIVEYARNTNLYLEKVQARGMDGLPIDAEKHDKGKAAGWITGLELGEIEDSNGHIIQAIYFTVCWTKLGVELLKEKIMTNFSPSFNIHDKIIKGGSLTNWPASVDENDVPIFEAVELSQGIKTFEFPDNDSGSEETGEVITEPENTDGGTDMSDVALEKLTDEDRQKLLTQAREQIEKDMPEIDENKIIERLRQDVKLQAFGEVVDLETAREQMMTEMERALRAEYGRMQAQAGQMLKGMLTEIKKDQDIAEFTERVTGGTNDVPYGFTIQRDELDTFLRDLDDQKRAAAMNILGRIWEKGRVGFNELGHGKRMKGVIPLPEYYTDKLDAGELELVDLRDPVLGLGDVDQYDLSKWKEA